MNLVLITFYKLTVNRKLHINNLCGVLIAEVIVCGFDYFIVMIDD